MHLIGTYTPPRGDAAGIHTLDAAGRVDLLVGLGSPSFVAAHPTLPMLYAVDEHRGLLNVVRTDDDTARVVQGDLVAGSAACHVRVADDGGSVVVACWGDGAVIRYALGSDGLVTDRVAVPPIEGLPAGVPSRAHASIALGAGFVTTDLGADVLRVWSGDASPRELQRLDLPTGSGPRHLVPHPNGSLYVVTEYSGEIVRVTTDAGRLEVASRAPTRVGAWVEGDTAAEIALHPSGEWLTIGVRGSDMIASSRIRPDGSTEPVAEAPCGGATPRHHVHDGDDVLIANQGSSLITRLPFDPATGALGPVTASYPVGTPTLLLRLG